MIGFGESFRLTHEEAFARAGAELARLGFRPGQDGTWTGAIHKDDSSTETIRVTFPATFPDAIPQFVWLHPPASCTPHVEVSGKLCLTPSSGFLIDTERPEQIIRDCLSRAGSVLKPMDQETRRKEITTEFTAYWSSASATILSVCTQGQQTGPIFAAEIDHGGRGVLLGPDENSVRDWLDAARVDLIRLVGAYFVRLNRLFEPPSPGTPLTARGESLLTGMV